MAVKKHEDFDIVGWLREFDQFILPLSEWKMKIATKIVFNPSIVPGNMWTLDIMNRMVGEQWLTCASNLEPIDNWHLKLPNVNGMYCGCKQCLLKTNTI